MKDGSTWVGGRGGAHRWAAGGRGGRNRDSWRMGGAEGRSVAGHGGPQLVCMQMGSSSEFEGLAGDPARGPRALKVSPNDSAPCPSKGAAGQGELWPCRLPGGPRL